ncbi:Major facilitator superfamily (MFS) profile domain-containing protein OS=Lysinibacillus sphaericus OX=1421 GN=LYSIN_03113 PE=4 SV=1 [Lysinibacillus sphaericus]
MILFKHSSIFLLGGILSLIVAMGIGRFAYTPILPLMQSDLSFSNAVGGYLATSNYAGYLLGAFLVGVIPVKQHRTFILRLSLVVSILTTASMGLFQSYFIWYGLRFISGISSAIVFVMASGIVLDKLAIRNKLNWSGIFYGGVGLGIFLSSLLIPILNRLYSWEGVWLGLSSVSMLLVLIVWISMKDQPLSFEKTSKQESALCVPPLKWIPWLIVAYGLEGLGYIVTGTFIVSIAKEIPSFHGDATVVWMVVGLAAIPSCIIWSELAKKIGFVKSLVLAMTLQAFGIALPALWVKQISIRF